MHAVCEDNDSVLLRRWLVQPQLLQADAARLAQSWPASFRQHVGKLGTLLRSPAEVQLLLLSFVGVDNGDLCVQLVPHAKLQCEHNGH